MRERNTLWHPAFGTVIVYLAIQFACVTLLSYSSSLFVNIIAEDLNAAVGTTQLRTVPGSIVAVLMLPFANKIYNKIGFKFSICLGVCSYCLAFVGMSFAPNVYVYIACGTLIGVGNALALFVPGPYMINAWFHKGTAIAIMIPTAGAALLATFTTPWIQGLIEAWGWRPALRFIALLGMAVGVVCTVLFAIPTPESRGMRPWGWTEDKNAAVQTKSNVVRGVSIKNARRSPVLYMLVIICMINGFPGVMSRFISPLATGSGFSTEQATLAVSIFAMGTTITTILVSFIVSAMGLKRYTLTFIVFNIICYLLLVFNGGNYVLFSIGLVGISLNSLNQMHQLAGKEIFGVMDLAEIIAIMNVGFNLVNMVSGSIMGYVYDFTGSYNGILLAIAVMLAISFVLVILIYKKKDSLPWEERTVEVAKK